jgi:hypothetical protein
MKDNNGLSDPGESRKVQYCEEIDGGVGAAVGAAIATDSKNQGLDHGDHRHDIDRANTNMFTSIMRLDTIIPGQEFHGGTCHLELYAASGIPGYIRAISRPRKIAVPSGIACQQGRGACVGKHDFR